MNPSDPIGRPREKGAFFSRLYPRVFRKKDYVSLLKAILEFSSLKNTLVVYDKDDEYEFVRKRLECSPSKRQFISKCTELKILYTSKVSEGVAAEGLTGDDAVIFELSEKLWGEEIKLQLKEKERDRSERSVRLENLKATLGLDGSDKGGGDVGAKSGGKLSGMESRKGGKRKKEYQQRKKNDEALVDMVSDKSIAKPGSEDGVSAQNVPPKKEKKGQDSRAKSRPVDENSASYESRKEKKHKRREGDGVARSPADSKLDRGEKEKSRKKKRHKGDETGEYKSLSENRKLTRNLSEKKDKHKGDELSQKLGTLSEKGSSSSQLDGRKSKKKKEKKHKGDQS